MLRIKKYTDGREEVRYVHWWEKWVAMQVRKWKAIQPPW